MKTRLLVAWGYLVEVLLASLLVLSTHIFLGSEALQAMVRAISSDIAAYFAVVMFASSIGFLWSFYAKADTEFYEWLSVRGADKVYLSAIAYCVFLSIALIFILIFVNYYENIMLSYIGLFLIFLSVICVVTLVRNVIGLMRLNNLFKKRFRR